MFPVCLDDNAGIESELHTMGRIEQAAATVPTIKANEVR